MNGQKMALIKDPKDPLKEDQILNNNINKRRKCQDLCCSIIKNTSIEPSVFLFATMYMVTLIVTQNLSLDKACRVNLNLTNKICSALRKQEIKGEKEYEGETHKLLASAMAWRTYLTASIPTLMSPVVGAWSDKTGRRKVFLLVGIIGQILISISDLVQTYFFYELDIIFLTLCDAFIYSLAGGWCFFIMCSYAYISSITNNETRTFRIGIFHFCNYIGYPIGAAMSGVLLKNFGYYGCYGCILSIHTINLLYVTFFVQDPKRNAEQKQHDNRGVWHFLQTFFDFSIVKEILSVVFKKRPNKKRLRIFFLLSVAIFVFGPYYGENQFLFMITRYQFQWNEIQFSLFRSYSAIVHTFGIISSLTLFSKIWKLNDSLLGILSGLSKIAGSIVYCFASNSAIFYLGPLLDMFNGVAMFIVNAIVSKTVNSDEIGKAMSLMSLAENLTPLVFIPLYSKIYIATMDTLPGTLYLVGAALILPAIAVFIWIFYEHKKTQRTSDMKNEVEIPLNS